MVQPHNAARHKSNAINSDAQWVPDPVLVANEIEKSVETLKEAVSYMTNALLRKGKSIGPVLFLRGFARASDDETIFHRTRVNDADKYGTLSETLAILTPVCIS